MIPKYFVVVFYWPWPFDFRVLNPRLHNFDKTNTISQFKKLIYFLPNASIKPTPSRYIDQNSRSQQKVDQSALSLTHRLSAYERKRRALLTLAHADGGRYNEPGSRLTVQNYSCLALTERACSLRRRSFNLKWVPLF